MPIISCKKPGCSAKIKIPDNNTRHFRCPVCKWNYNEHGTLVSGRYYPEGKKKTFIDLKDCVLSGSWGIASRHDGNPLDNQLIKEIGAKHKVGFFESVHKLIIRSAMEDEESCLDLWEANLIGFTNYSTGKEYTAGRVGNINEVYKKLD